MRWKALAAVALLVAGVGAVAWAVTGGPSANGAGRTQYLQQPDRPDGGRRGHGRRHGRPGPGHDLCPRLRPGADRRRDRSQQRDVVGD